MRVLDRSNRKVNITGIDNHQVTGLDIVTAAALVTSDQGPIVLILHQYAYLGQGKTIHSSGQLEHYSIEVDDRSRVVKGKQRIVTLEGYKIPLQVRDGLVYMDQSVPTDRDMEAYNHVIMTSDVDWDPAVLDTEIDIDDWN